MLENQLKKYKLQAYKTVSLCTISLLKSTAVRNVRGRRLFRLKMGGHFQEVDFFRGIFDGFLKICCFFEVGSNGQGFFSRMTFLAKSLHTHYGIILRFYYTQI